MINLNIRFLRETISIQLFDRFESKLRNYYLWLFLQIEAAESKLVEPETFP